MYINMYMQLQLSYSNNCTYSILSAYLTLHPKIKSTLGRGGGKVIFVHFCTFLPCFLKVYINQVVQKCTKMYENVQKLPLYSIRPFIMFLQFYHYRLWSTVFTLYIVRVFIPLKIEHEYVVEPTLEKLQPILKIFYTSFFQRSL